MNLEAKPDQLKEEIPGARATKQNKVVTNRDKGRKTFQKIRDRTVTDVLTLAEVEKFLRVLRRVSLRNYLVGAIQLQRAKRIAEVLEARIEDIYWELDLTNFKQKKSLLVEKQTQVFFLWHVMRSLKEYIGER